ncbi:hypothetical protein [uncultured Nostoc sp.]|uniref:hypothetical protein n=1 Tax=uncultured Nostoc sp. TaxID=340711 RepID=UPI0035CB8036
MNLEQMLGYPALSAFGSTFLKRHLQGSSGNRIALGVSPWRRAQWLPNLQIL